MTDEGRLSPELEALLDLERQAPLASAAAKARVLERLESTLGLGGPGGGQDGGGGQGGSTGPNGSGSAAPASASSSGLLPVAGVLGIGKAAVGWWAAGIAALSLTAGLIVGALQGDRERTSSPTAPAAIAEVAEAAAAIDEPGPIAATGTAPAEEELFVINEDEVTVRSAAPPARPARERPAVAQAPFSRLADEQALLDAARASLAAGDAAAAERSLRAHEASFSGGTLAEERTALLVLALARAGRMDAAARTAAAFRVRWPDSLHLATVEAALEERR